MAELPFVSIIVPCRNEAALVRRAIDSLASTDYPRERLEVLFVDGLSVDGTREILAGAARAHPFMRVLDNPRLTAPAALNVGISRARGDVIVRVDAHCEVPPDYVRRCVRLLQESGAACAGGMIETLPNGERPWARAVAAVTANALGVGDSRFRIGGRAGFVDTVPGGAFSKAIVERVGLFDERLTRNQDNELSARLRKHGYKIAFDPDIRARYWNQATLRGLVRQAFYTGMWNVYTLVLHPYTWKSSRFVPAAFVGYLAGLGAMGAAGAHGAAPAVLPLCLYAALVAGVSAAKREGGGALRVAATVVVYHCAYGLGTHAGAVNLLTGRWRLHLGRPLRR